MMNHVSTSTKIFTRRKGTAANMGEEVEEMV